MMNASNANQRGPDSSISSKLNNGVGIKYVVQTWIAHLECVFHVFNELNGFHFNLPVKNKHVLTERLQ